MPRDAKSCCGYGSSANVGTPVVRGKAVRAPSAAVRMAVATSGKAWERSSQLRENTHTLPFLSRCICSMTSSIGHPARHDRPSAFYSGAIRQEGYRTLVQALQQRQTWALMPSYLYSARKGRPSSTPSCFSASGTPSVMDASIGFRGTPAAPQAVYCWFSPIVRVVHICCRSASNLSGCSCSPTSQ